MRFVKREDFTVGGSLELSCCSPLRLELFKAAALQRSNEFGPSQLRRQFVHLRLLSVHETRLLRINEVFFERLPRRNPLVKLATLFRTPEMFYRLFYSTQFAERFKMRDYRIFEMRTRFFKRSTEDSDRKVERARIPHAIFLPESDQNCHGDFRWFTRLMRFAGP